MPAMVTFATFDAGRTGHVASPITPLVGLHLFAYSVLEVFVADYTIFVSVEEVKKLIKLLIGSFNAPVREIELKVVRVDTSAFRHI